MATLQELLGALNQTALITKTPSGVPLSVPAQFAVPTRRNIGPSVQYYMEVGQQGLAQVVHYGSPPRGMGKKNAILKTATALHTTHFHQFDMMEYQNLLAPDGSPQRIVGEFEMVRQTQHMKAKYVNLRYAAIQRALVNGVLYFDVNGNMLASSSGAAFTVDYGIPAGHKNQLDVYGTGAFIDASWATASTDIPAHIQKILDAALQQSGLPITTAIYGSAILNFLANNNFVKALLPASPGLAAAFGNQQIPSGFLGIKNWIPASSAFYESSAGTIVKIWPTDAVVFCPDVSTSWYDLIDCSYLTPTNLGAISADAATAAGFVQQVFGMWQYAKLQDEPVTIRLVSGDTFLPMIVNPLATYIADVVP